MLCLKENNKHIARFYTVFLQRSILYSPLNFQVIKAAAKYYISRYLIYKLILMLVGTLPLNTE